MKSDKEFLEAIGQKVAKIKEERRLSRARLCFHGSAVSLLLCCLCFLAMAPAEQRGGSADGIPVITTTPFDSVLEDSISPSYSEPIAENSPTDAPGNPPEGDSSSTDETLDGSKGPTDGDDIIESVISTADESVAPDVSVTSPPIYQSTVQNSHTSSPPLFLEVPPSADTAASHSFLLPLAVGFLLLSLLFFVLAVEAVDNQFTKGAPL